MPHRIFRIDKYTTYLVLGIIIAAAIAFWDLMWVLILSLSVAVVVMPLHRRLSRKIGEEVSAVVVSFLLFLILLGAIISVVSILQANSDYLAEIFATLLDWFRMQMSNQAAWGLPISSDRVVEWIHSQIGRFEVYITDIVQQIPMLIVQFCVFFLTLYYALLRGDQVLNEVLSHLPHKVASALSRMSEVTVNTLYAIYVVHVATSVITFIIAVPFFYFLGYGHVIFYSLTAAIFQLIPIIGPSLLMVLIAVYAFALGDIRGVFLIALIGYPVVCALPDLYFRPMMMGARASIHPVIMWIGFFGGLAVMGIVGFVLGPLFLALIVSGYHILMEDIRAREAEEGRSLPGENRG